MKLRSVAMCSLLLAGCVAPKTIAPLSVPLQYQMVAVPSEYPSVPSCAGIAAVKVKDARPDQKIGVRYLEANPSQRADVNAASDVAEWVRTGFEAGLKQSGIPVAGSGQGTLSLTIDNIKTNENVLHRSGYDGRILLLAELTQNGKSCWQGQGDGRSDNYGYSGSIENYQETLNHALDRAVIGLVESSEFRKGACSC